MRPVPRPVLGAIGAVLCLAGAPVASAADNQAGVPLNPGDAAGSWTLETQGKSLCVVKLSTRKSPGGFALSAGSGCGDVLPTGASGWTPTGDGMAITGDNGAVLIAFGRWSNSLLVSHRASGADLQLKRGLPGAMPGTD